MKNLTYEELKIQKYLTNKNTTVEEKITLFKWRTRMENFVENFKGGKSDVVCKICKSHVDSQTESFNCPEIRKTFCIEADYKDIFSDSPSLNTVKTVDKISKLRKKIINSQ